jgi:hypothetical protein
VPFTRSVTIAALIGAAMLASPPTAARAASATQMAPATAPQKEAGSAAAKGQSQAAAGASETKGETVEQRITALQTALEITPEQEPLWKDVAQAMRENAANMGKIVAEDLKLAPQDMTAVQSLKAYQKFAQARVDGLKNLTAAFETLYHAMPAAQKKNADEVFLNYGHKGSLRRK